ncbi:MAG: hypothetical protein HON76_18045 [Candidatus Scalindua sp.]|nr:hypothetical protein [Candidatus Scalindua sp.]MBT5306371.1 hypothetical protein [Candidatus Scalindua sp.]MBT6225939.1 hypothetical protein [Candidatus Scalindua sp.]MBT6564423.1 hypothetical protein [Candidatus Scalindua sp.]MBT7210023.1 hypothetical protein [Candidatus Scalindua sp.]
MEEYEIEAVTKILADWNPLGDRVKSILDDDGYRTEAIDILFYLNMEGLSQTTKIVMEILNEAFDLSLSKDECSVPANKISNILRKKN